jgi:tRNA threonylcarbamoyl adenosine modification protein (Sua5/YciO/YrdC/YwlC family)
MLCFAAFVASTCSSSSSGSSRTALFAKPSRTSTASSSSTSNPVFISVEDVHSDLWQLEKVIDVLREGGVGVLPTDTCYSFVTRLSSQEGVKRVMRLKGAAGQKKPLSLLCKDVSTISKYTSALTDQKWVFKLLKAALPGPFTFILPANKEVPKLILADDKKWKRKEIGVRLPDDVVCGHVLDALDEPLLCGSVPEALEDEVGILSMSALRALDSASSGGNEDAWEEDDDDGDDDENALAFDGSYVTSLGSCRWYSQVDFVVENGPRGVIVDEVSAEKKGKKGGKSKAVVAAGMSTVVDLTRDPPVLLRQGKGPLDAFDAIQNLIVP